MTGSFPTGPARRELFTGGLLGSGLPRFRDGLVGGYSMCSHVQLHNKTSSPFLPYTTSGYISKIHHKDWWLRREMILPFSQ